MFNDSAEVRGMPVRLAQSFIWVTFGANTTWATAPDMLCGFGGMNSEGRIRGRIDSVNKYELVRTQPPNKRSQQRQCSDSGQRKKRTYKSSRWIAPGKVRKGGAGRGKLSAPVIREKWALWRRTWMSKRRRWREERHWRTRRPYKGLWAG